MKLFSWWLLPEAAPKILVPFVRCWTFTSDCLTFTNDCQLLTSELTKELALKYSRKAILRRKHYESGVPSPVLSLPAPFHRSQFNFVATSIFASQSITHDVVTCTRPPVSENIWRKKTQQTLKSSSSPEKWKRQVKFTRGCKAHPSISLLRRFCFSRYWNVLIKGSFLLFYWAEKNDENNNSQQKNIISHVF